jgi:hypothetical protein
MEIRLLMGGADLFVMKLLAELDEIRQATRRREFLG